MARTRTPSKSSESNAWALSATVAALLIFPLAIGLPVVEVERFGHLSEASIWSGTISLLGQGEWFVGTVVLACSVVIPLGKLLGLAAITLPNILIDRRTRARTYRMIEAVGRWGMVDVLLVALMVAFLKLGDLVEVHPGPGVGAFTLCVGLSLAASACFDPHAIWERTQAEES